MTPTRPDNTICPQSPARVTRSTQISTGSPPPPPGRRNGEKPRADPSITPRKFRKFFTPRSVGNNHNSAARQALFDITNPANNRDVIQSSPIRPARSLGGQENSPTAFTRGLKRRKIVHIEDGATEHKYSSRKSQRIDAEGDESEDGLDVLQSSPVKQLPSSRRMVEEDEDEEMLDLPVLPRRPVNRISAVADRGLAGRLYQMNLGCTSRGARHRYEYPVNDWQDETHAFHSRKADIHTNHSLESGNLCIPFSSTSCNTNTSIAVGDEEGRVRMLETQKGGEKQLKTSWLNFRVHTNAIIDMSFVDDDSLLATASGDATARVVDMRTQVTTAVLGNHYASLKQVRWQPGSHSILATSSRDGCIQIWDLRTTGYDGPATCIQAPVEPRHRTTIRTAARKTLFGRPVNSLIDCHKNGQGHNSAPTSAQSSDVPSQGETVGRAGDVSVTAIEFLPGGQDHILSACEGDASVKVWDIRHVHGRRKNPIPISQTQHPSAHVGWRHFGVTSMSLNTSGSRLYTLCKDNTVYAYSTAHLILGHAPELSMDHEGKKLPLRATQQGLGPLYGYRHPKLHINSFYVKSAIRKAEDGKSEMLAVGSSNGNAILFPTDERYLPKVQQPEEEDWSSLPQNRSGLRRVGSGAQTMSQRVAESCPISQNGTVLSNGHSREVGCLHWNTDGELVTVGDDYLVRVWREGDGARELRKGTVEAGRAGHNGWAEVNKKYDEYEDDEE
ncbi:WD40-repeat-containing domain protein [Halenospora varia]|nr:WD40-repeat-containing domain protein [Halenospora varia]